VTEDTLDNDPAWWDAWRGILFANAHVLSRVEALLQEHSGLSMSFFDVMGRLHDAPDQRLRMQDLQAHSLFTRSGMTRLVDRIEEAGYVVRERVPGDRRGVYVVLTPEGDRAWLAGMGRHREDVEQVFGELLTTRQHEGVAKALWSFWHADEDDGE
jgi:DNA-binding MarR family transcriptional regulator